MSRKRVDGLTAQQRLEKRMERRAAMKRRAEADQKVDTGGEKRRLAIIAQKDDRGNYELVGFDSNSSDPEELTGLLCMAIARVITMSRHPSINWPHWIHYTSNFVANALSQGTTSALASLGVDNEMVQGYLAKHKDTMDKETTEAFEAFYRERAEAAKEGKRTTNDKAN